MNLVNSVKALIFKFIRFMGYELSRIEYVVKRERQKTLWLENYGIKTVIDIGANEGQFAKYIHEILPQAKIYSFEPLEDCFEKLLSNLEGVSNFQAFNCALGEEVDESIIYRNKFSQSSSLLPMLELHQLSFPFTSIEVVKEERVKIFPLDDFSSKLEIRNPFLVKIDVQGFEDKVINGGSNILKKADVIMIEMSTLPLYAGQVLFDDLYHMMKNLGFRYQGNFGQFHSAEDGKVVQIDAFFVRN